MLQRPVLQSIADHLSPIVNDISEKLRFLKLHRDAWRDPNEFNQEDAGVIQHLNFLRNQISEEEKKLNRVAYLIKQVKDELASQK